MFEFGLDDDVGYYEAPEKKVALNLRVEESIKLGIESLVRLWRALAVARGDDPKDIDQTMVIKRLLRVGLEGAFAEAMEKAGLKRLPTSPEEWKALEKALEKLARESR